MLAIKVFIFLFIYIHEVFAADTCGVKMTAAGLIYGGKMVKPGEWPWVVPLFYREDNAFFCSSNLISHQHLLTVAHCVHEKHTPAPVPKEKIYAYVGIYDLTMGDIDPVASVQNIKRIAVHPMWNPNDKKYDSDVALLTLYNNVYFSRFVQPICLPDKNLQIGIRRGAVVGYGKSENPTPYEPKPKVTEISSHTNDECFFADPNYAAFGSPTTFCAGEVGKNPCKGDSGGGFFIKESEWRIAGLVSSALDVNCALNQFVLFTNVVKFVDWIQLEMTRTDDNTGSSQNSFYDLDEVDQGATAGGDKRYQYGDCRFELSRDAYTCHIEGMMTPNADIALAISDRGQHQSGRSNRDVTTVQMKNGQVTHFPETSKVVEAFPQMTGFSITFTKLKHIKRSEVAPLKDLKYFLISDNEIEEIPSDTFYDMQKLEFIDICRNKVSVLDPNWTLTMPNLKVFKARSNLFRVVPSELFAQNPRLEEVLLDKNQIQINQKDYSSLQNIKTVAMLENPCINIEYCKNGNKSNDKCVRSLRQFTYIVYGFCGNFNE